MVKVLSGAIRMICRAALLLPLVLPATASRAQESITTEPDKSVIVLDDALERWISSAYRAAALCRSTLEQLITEHGFFTEATRRANAQKLSDALAEQMAAAQAEMFAKGLTFEQSLAIDSYFHSYTQPKTALYVTTLRPADLAIDLRACPAARQRLALQVEEAAQ